MFILYFFHLVVLTHPTFYERYNINGTIILPYSHLVIPYTIYYDGTTDSSYISYYSDTSFLLSSKLYKSTSIIPASYNGRNQFICFAGGKAQSILPDLSGFKKDPSRTNCSSELYQSKYESCISWIKEETHFGRNNTYIFYTDQKMTPVRYEMYGYDTLLGSHYDQYVVVYETYQEVEENSVDLKIRDKIDEICPHASIEEIYHVDLILQLFFEEDDHLNHFEKIRKQHNINFISLNAHWEAQIKFRHSLRYIMAHNSKNSTFKMAPNHKVFESKSGCRLAHKKNEVETNPMFLGYFEDSRKSKKLPKNLDWRYFGAVSPVKDQAICGSCWSFGATGVIESHYFLKTNNSVLFSEQQLVDCSWAQENGGCFGGLDTRAYTFIKKFGLASDKEYGGYKGEDLPCRLSKFHRYFNISGYKQVKINEQAVMSALYHGGPISISIDASLPSFSFYHSGVYYDEKCSSMNLDHTVLLVGYGTTSEGEDYWLVKNSWSTHWGDQGYIKISRKFNNCGVMTEGTIPIFD